MVSISFLLSVCHNGSTKIDAIVDANNARLEIRKAGLKYTLLSSGFGDFCARGIIVRKAIRFLNSLSIPLHQLILPIAYSYLQFL